MMTDMAERHGERMAAFAEEAQELLAGLEEALLEAEAYHGRTVDDEVESVNAIFRSLHTLKGIAAMVGLDDLVGLSNDLETVFAQVRSGQLPLDDRLAGLTFRFKDFVQRFLDAPHDGLDMDTAGDIASELAGLYDSAGSCPPPEAAAKPRAASCQALNHFHVRYAPQGGALAVGGQEVILEQLRGLGETRLAADLSALPELDGLDPEACFLAWDVVLSTDRDEDALSDLLFFVEGPEGTLTWSRTEAPTPCARPKAVLAAASAVSPGTSGPAAGAAQAQRPDKGQEAASIRVPADKLDDLVDLVGQIVIAQVRLRQIEGELSNPHLTSVVEEMERLGDTLRDRALSLRMLPIGNSFGRFRRLVRDLSCDLGKEIDLVTSGEETELDKTVIERLGDPLVHILRNAMDHGLEPPEEREAAGKPRRGTVGLHARQEGGRVNIVVSDDGRGIDVERVLAKAVHSGLTRGEPRPRDEEILDFIFQPGFSTASQVTSVSGRGVGMDVVKRAVEALKGSVRIASEKGRGTSLTISLPLTLAIIDGLHVRVGDECYVIPLADVVECVETARDEADRARANSTVDIRGRLVPCLGLRRFFGIAANGVPRIEQVVVVRSQGGHTGLIVDGIIGQRQTVIKGLGRIFEGVKGVSGATIMGDGSLALILDLPSLLRAAEG